MGLPYAVAEHTLNTANVYINPMQNGAAGTNGYANYIFAPSSCTATGTFYSSGNNTAQFEIDSLSGQTLSTLNVGASCTQSANASYRSRRLPQYQGRGLATAALRRLQQEASVLTLHVLKGNPAERLYRHLGFRVTHET